MIRLLLVVVVGNIVSSVFGQRMTHPTILHPSIFWIGIGTIILKYLHRWSLFLLQEQPTVMAFG